MESVDYTIDGYVFNVPMLVQVHEAAATTELFGIEKSAYKTGQNDGLQLDPSLKENAAVCIRAVMAAKEEILKNYIRSYLIHLGNELFVQQQFIAQKRIHIAGLETQAGSKYFESASNKEVVLSIRAIEQESELEYEKISNQFRNQVQKVEHTLVQELNAIEIPVDSSLSGHQKMMELTLKYGRPIAETDSDKVAGYYNLMKKQMQSIVLDEIKGLWDKHLKIIQHYEEDLEGRIKKIQENLNLIPTYRAALTTTFIAIVLFSVEVPLHFVFTTNALKLFDNQMIVLKYIFSIGLPLGLGLATRWLLDKKDLTITNRQKRMWGTLIFMLIVCIGVLNGIKGQKDDLLEAVLRALIFIGLTSVLTITGALYFGLAGNMWKARRAMGFSSLYKKTNRKQQRDLEAQIHLEKQVVAQTVEKKLKTETEMNQLLQNMEAINDLITHNLQHRAQSMFDQYNFGFERGWSQKINQLFQSRKPIPLRKPDC